MIVSGDHVVKGILSALKDGRIVLVRRWHTVDFGPLSAGGGLLQRGHPYYVTSGASAC